MDDLQDRVAFITGGAGGIGVAIAQALAAQGVKLVLADINGAELEKAAGAVSGEVLTLKLDVTDRSAWTRARAAAEARFGQVDILCNNAGIASDGRGLADMPPENFDRVIGINLTGVFNGVSAFVPGMVERGLGHVVNLSSICGLLGMPDLGAYTASKFGVLGLSYGLRSEMAGRGVGVTAVCPGQVDTRIAENTRSLGGGREPGPFQGTVRQHILDPREVGRLVLEAIRNDEELVVTHPEYRPLVAQLGERTLAAFDRIRPPT